MNQQNPSELSRLRAKPTDEESKGLQVPNNKSRNSPLIDLTLTIEHGQRGVDFETARTIEENGWNARTLHLYSHSGTHLDAPLHFGVSDKTVDQIPLESCMGLAHVVNLTELPERALIELEQLGEIVDKFVPGESLLLRTGWSRHADRPDHYRNRFPRIADSLAEWCAGAGVKMLGVEPPSVADVNDRVELTRIHKTLLAADIVIVESLTNLERLTSNKVFFAAIPLKVGGGDGTPCRAFAIDGPIEFPPLTQLMEA